MLLFVVIILHFYSIAQLENKLRKGRIDDQDTGQMHVRRSGHQKPQDHAQLLCCACDFPSMSWSISFQNDAWNMPNQWTASENAGVQSKNAHWQSSCGEQQLALLCLKKNMSWSALSKWFSSTLAVNGLNLKTHHGVFKAACDNVHPHPTCGRCCSFHWLVVLLNMNSEQLISQFHNLGWVVALSEWHCYS